MRAPSAPARGRSQPRWPVPLTERFAIVEKGSGGAIRREATNLGGKAPSSVWASGDLYEPYVGRWSRLVARDFLDWLDAPSGLDWLEVGCGTGALTEMIADSRLPARLVAIDSSAGYLGYARQRLGPDRAEFREADAQELPFPAAGFDR